MAHVLLVSGFGQIRAGMTLAGSFYILHPLFNFFYNLFICLFGQEIFLSNLMKKLT